MKRLSSPSVANANQSTSEGSAQLTHKEVPQKTLNSLTKLLQEGQWVKVIEKAELLTQEYSSTLDLWLLLGYAAVQSDRFLLAEKALVQALALNPDADNLHNNMGNVLRKQGQLEAALAAYDKALALKCNNAETHYNRGMLLQELGQSDAALAAYSKTLVFKPNYAEAHHNMGIVLQKQDKQEAALAAYHKALALKPNYAEAYFNMGIILQNQHKLGAALAAFIKASMLKPNYAIANYNQSLIHLLQGSIEEGFKQYEWRLGQKDRVRPARGHLVWDGQRNLQGKHFLIYEEQGLGDIIQFCRYCLLLVHQGAQVTFKVTPKLHTLLTTLDSNINLIADFPEDGKIDFEAPLLSLPYLFNTKIDTIPALNPYLYANQKKVAAWSRRLQKGQFNIGICWQGRQSKIDLGRSFSLALFSGIASINNVQLISLHKGEGEKQLQEIAFDVITLGEQFDAGHDAFVDTAAVMINCDLIITSDTSIAHLAGALGCPTWVALKYVPDWRWMLNRTDTPWYPNTTLYRQTHSGDWQDVFASMQNDLLDLVLKKGK